ncbi:MAG: hypothetical protein WB820_23485 [Rhodoplanes sp.]
MAMVDPSTMPALLALLALLVAVLVAAPQLKPAKIFRLAFRDKGRLIDSPEHALFRKWAARDADAG